MESCIFCKIIKGEIPSEKIYEDDKVFSFLDIRPLTKGHCLVIPKKHFENIFDIEDEMLRSIISAAKKISIKIRETLKSDGINFLQSNGEHAGQEVFHYHLHLIPRYKDYNIIGNWAHVAPKNADPQDLKKIALHLRSG